MSGLTILAGAATLDSTAVGQTFAWNNPAGGSWSDIGNWSPSVFPNAAMHNALIAVPGTYTVSLNSLITLQGLVISNAAADLHIQPGGQIRVRENGVNTASTIRIGGTFTAPSNMTFEATATLAGAGRIFLDSPDDFGSTLGGGAGFTIDAGFTVAGGRGTVTGYNTNNGSIVAEGPNNAPLQVFGLMVNNGILKSTPNGLLQIRTFAVTQTSSGQIVADGGSVEIFDGTVSGGAIRTDHGGTLVFGGPTYTNLNDVTVAGLVGIRGGTSIRVNSSTLKVTGTLVVNADRSGSSELLYFNTGSIQGPGTVLLNGFGNSNAGTSITHGSTLSLGPSLTVAGTGRLHGQTMNSGRIAPGPIEGGIGQITFDYPVWMLSSSILDFEVMGPSPIQADRLNSSVNPVILTVGGTLRVRAVGGFTLSPGLSWVLLQSNPIYGNFSTLDLPPPAGGVYWRATKTDTQVVLSTVCYADCDGVGGLTANDFACFLRSYARSLAYANCDGSTSPPTVNPGDFQCFLTAYSAGCS